MWPLRRGRLTTCFGSIRGPVGRDGAWDPKWFNGTMTLSLGRPRLLHHYYGDLTVRWLVITEAIHTTPTGAMKALTGLPRLDPTIQVQARSAAHSLWSLGCWFCFPPNRGHSIPTRLQKSDPIFSMEVDVMRPAFNLEPKYRVTMLTRDEWTRGHGTPPIVNWLVCLQMGP